MDNFFNSLININVLQIRDHSQNDFYLLASIHRKALIRF